jgi:hypothetical protein
MSLAGPHPNLALDTYLLNVGRPTHHLGSKRGELKHPWAGALRKFQFLLQKLSLPGVEPGFQQLQILRYFTL